jgi:hypothetical protein
MRGRLATIVTVLMLGVIPATASATPEDIASTHAYIRANYAFARATNARTGAAQAKVDALNQQLGEECRGAGAGSPQNEESQKISYEVVAALWSTTYSTDAGPINTFVDAVKRLHWSNPRIARLAQRYATSLHELATLPMPNICSDIAAWKASSFKTVPATTTQLVHHVEEIEGKTVPSPLLAPYEKPADRAILASTIRLEAKLERTETVVGLDDWNRTLETLGLNQ